MPEKDRLVDLHVHTSASDGAFSPGETVRRAAAAGLAALAVTDHDTIGGLAEAREAAREAGIDFVIGLEISAEFPGGTMHILGYEFDPSDGPLAEALRQFLRNRDERNPQILAALARMGMPLEYEDVASRAGGEAVGRPHIAQAMVDAGYVRTTDEAFKKYLAKGCPAYVNRRRIEPAEAIRLIRDAGGLAALAHPVQLQRPFPEVRKIVGELTEAGLEGLEVWHPEHSADDMRTYEVLARQLGLVAVGGTDYHGHMRAGVEIGVGRGNLRVPYRAVEELRQRLADRPGPAEGAARAR